MVYLVLPVTVEEDLLGYDLASGFGGMGFGCLSCPPDTCYETIGLISLPNWAGKSAILLASFTTEHI